MVSWGQLGLRRYSMDMCFTGTRHGLLASSRRFLWLGGAGTGRGRATDGPFSEAVVGF